MRQNDRKILHSISVCIRGDLDWLLANWDSMVILALSICMMMGTHWYVTRHTTPEEAAVRTHMVQIAQQYLGCNEADGSHRRIVDRYNAHIPRARDYEVTYEDSWCAVFTGTVTLETGLQDWIPLECSCEQQILLFDSLGRWVEDDDYLPKPGDFIYYDWNSTGSGNCKGWSDHVGIVVQTLGPVIKVIEGNKNNDVSYRYVFVNDPFIRGFGTPDYEAISQT